MKKMALWMVSTALLMSSCGTYTGEGAAVGGQFGTILGSAIGGLTGGWRGSQVGQIVGMAGGAAVGAAIGAAADKKAEERVAEYHERKAAEQRRRESRSYQDDSYDRYDDGGVSYTPSNRYGGGNNTTDRPIYSNNSTDRYDSNDNNGDDRIDFNGAGPRDGVGRYDFSGDYNQPGISDDAIQIRNVRIVDADRDGVIRAGEECQVMFEIMNRSSRTIYDVQPTVYDISRNRDIHISPNLHVESIAPHSGVRYTANILAGHRLRDGKAVIKVGVMIGNRAIESQMRQFTVPTRRK